jgi:hypothetical protein
MPVPLDPEEQPASNDQRPSPISPPIRGFEMDFVHIAQLRGAEFAGMIVEVTAQVGYALNLCFTVGLGFQQGIKDNATLSSPGFRYWPSGVFSTSVAMSE